MTSSNEFTRRLFNDQECYISTFEHGGKRRCLGCMKLFPAEYEICPHCGSKVKYEAKELFFITPGKILIDRYIIGKSLRKSETGVTYLSWDKALQRVVEIEELFPNKLVYRHADSDEVYAYDHNGETLFFESKMLYINELNRLKCLKGENGVIEIYDVFECNNTVYSVFKHDTGVTLKKFVNAKGTLSVKEAINIIAPLLETLSYIHEEKIMHLNINPNSIIIREDGTVGLINYGFVENYISSTRRICNTSFLSAFSSYECCAGKVKGPVSDVYSLGAIMYYMLTGTAPIKSTDRVALINKNGKDRLKPIKKYRKDVPRSVCTAIGNAMILSDEKRTPDIITFAGELFSEEKNQRKKESIKRIDEFKWPAWSKISLSIAAFVIVIFGMLNMFGLIGEKPVAKNNFAVSQGQTIVPDIVTSDLSTARGVLEKYNLRLVIADTEESRYIAKNLVMKQYPDAGSVVSYGTIIKITSSAGCGYEIVENVKGFAIDSAQKLLESSGFEVVTREEKNSEYARGVVVKQSVAAGTELEKGSEITLTVSRGNESIVTSTQIEIPNLLGQDYETARRSSEKNGIYLAISEIAYDPSLPDGRILKQNPEPSEKSGHAGEIITVTVNRETDSTYVPNVVYMNYEKAETTLEDLGFVVTKQYKPSIEVAEGTVISQSVASGQTVKLGTKITITLSSGYTTIVPNVIGKTLDDAQKELMNCGFSSEVESHISSADEKGIVIDQSEKAGSRAEVGTDILLVISD